MKKVTSILILTILFASAIVDKEIPSKLYYLDKEYVESSDYYASDGDFAIFLWDLQNDELFNFKPLSKTYEIYYDKAFTSLAVKIKATKDNKEIHYQRYDKNKILRMEFFKINSKYFGQYRSWYSNSNLKNITYYDSQGETIADSTFYSDKKLSRVSFYLNNEEYKECSYNKNNKIVEEIYYSHPGHNAVFFIKFDSITNIPRMFYNNDSIFEDKNNPGTFIAQQRLIPADSAIIKKK